MVNMKRYVSAMSVYKMQDEALLLSNATLRSNAEVDQWSLS